MKIAIIDKLGLCYDGDTLSKQGLGGSESAVILMAKNLQQIGFEVTVFNNCKDGQRSKPGIYDNVRYVDNADAENHKELYDIVVVSRTVMPFVSNKWPFLHSAKKRVLWLHDSFMEGDHLMEDLVVSGKIDHVFTLSDWHTSYILTCAHGKKRNFEVLKRKIFQTRNGAVCYIPEVDLNKKDPNHFVYNSSATKGMLPLVNDVWPKIKEKLPNARLTIIGGHYIFRENAEPDAQESIVEQLVNRQDLKDLGVTFTGVIPQYEIAKILANAWMMLYPGAFPETFGISSLESLLYKTPLMTTRFGALEETAVDLACYHIDYAIEPNNLFPHINKDQQVQKFLETFFAAYSIPYLHQQKQNYCDVVKDIAGWDTVALQWKQFFYTIAGQFLPVDDYRKVTRINDKVARVFGRTGNMPVQKEYRSFGKERPITVISPFWNAAAYIEKNIRSVAAQDYDNYIHVLIDDCSDDDSYVIAKRTIASLPERLRDRFFLRFNEENLGCIYNQLNAINDLVDPEDIVMLLDGDDWLINNNTVFQYYNDLYDQGYEFTYGSMWSVVDNIPLIAQDYPAEVKKNKTYRSHQFNWKIPYTHLRTCLGKHFADLDKDMFKVDGKWMKAGADNPLFYELIERVDSNKIYCNKEIVCNYNDANPLNDYKIRGEEQNRNAGVSRVKQKDNNVEKFSVVIPTMWRALDVFEKALNNYLNHELIEEVIIIDNDKNAKPDWTILKHPKVRLMSMVQNIFVNPAWNLGVSLTKNDKLIIANDDIEFDINLIDKIHPRIRSDNGVHGITAGEPIFMQPLSTDYSIDFKEWEPGDNIHGFGQLMFLHKDNWKPIDDNIKIYYGDDAIFHWHLFKGFTNYMIYNIKFYSPMASTTKDSSITGGQLEKEFPIYAEWESKYPLSFSKMASDEHKSAKLSPSDINEHVDKTKKRILVAIPTAKYIESETFKSLFDLTVPNGYELEFQYFYGYSISQIRNLIADWAKRYDYLFSLDSDIVLPKDTLTKMLNADKDIISGLYIQRIPNTHTLEVYMDIQNGGCINIPNHLIKDKGVVEIAACGMGCVLIKSEVFRKMSYPHFFYKEALNHADTVSEDVFFCMKARANGFKVWADASIQCDHIGNTKYVVNNNSVPSITAPVDNKIQQNDLNNNGVKIFK